MNLHSVAEYIRGRDWALVVVTGVAIVFLGGVAIAFGFVQSRTEELDETIDLLELEIEKLRGRLLESGRELDEARKLLQDGGGGAESPVPVVEDRPGEFVLPFAEEDYIGPTSPFGIRLSPIVGEERHHDGVDMVGVWRAQVVSVADGVVVEHWPPPGTRGSRGIVYQGNPVFGGYVVIEHPGVDGLSRYGHLSSTRVHEGDRVSAGEVIGRQGATGKAVGAHLHLELEIDGKQVNPLLYLPWEER